MSDKGSVAPKERVNIVYKSHTGDKSEEVELPLKLLVLGDFIGRHTEDVVEERQTININKENFDEVMKSYGLFLNLRVPNTLEAQKADANELSVQLTMQGIKDFTPDHVVEQVPELKSLLELRKSLLALKGPLGNVPAFRKSIQNILSDDVSKERLMRELGISESDA